jgi:hypothetical protein
MKPTKIAIHLFLLLLWAVATNARSSELEERHVVLDNAALAYANGDFASLKRQHELYSDFLHQRTSSGASKMSLFFDGIANYRLTTSEPQRKQDIEQTLGWVAANRDSPLAYVLHVGALYMYGGYFRGDGYANTVPPQAWKIYEEYVQKAGKFLLESKSVGSKSSSWYDSMIGTANLAGWPENVARGILEEAIGKYPADFRLYRDFLEYLSPRWHGNTHEIDKFINYATSKAPPDYGLEMYARLYSQVGENDLKRRLYSDSLIDWKKMKKGLDLWYKRFPTPWNKNILAYHACMAGDKKFTKQLLTEIGRNPVLDIWEPNSQATFDTCTIWANDPKAERSAPGKAPKSEDEKNLNSQA